MSKKNKLQKFADILSYPNVYECYDYNNPGLVGAGMEPVELKGAWSEKHFGNQKPITLELACGGGEYTVGLARMFPERNFIGMDIKGNRIWRGATAALEEGLNNVAFVRARIELIELFFAANEIAEIWITFPDPFPKSSKENRRLTSDFFTKKYRSFLQKNGLVHLKHDDPGFYAFTLETIEADPESTLLLKNDDIYSGPLPMPELDIKTAYEKMHLEVGKKIHYVRYTIH
ncbi:MAG: tRNA (guanosine(46)-N7)-methyltransferase TrmB [Saprospiraceae bacterium]